MTADEMINRYTYAVARHLPAAQRADIRAELTALIADEAASRREAGETEADAVRGAIRNFGPPRTVALNYHAAQPVIEPRDTRGFVKAAAIGIGALCVLGLSVALSDPRAGAETLFADEVGRETALAILQYLGVLLLVFWGLGTWHRRAGSRRWLPDRLPAVPDPGAVNRPLMGAAIAFWTVGLAILAAGPANLIQDGLGAAAPAPLVAAFTYDPGFVASRALILWTVLALSILTYAWPIVSGRRSRTWRRIDAAASIIVSLVLYALVLAGDVFAQEPANQYMKLAMAIFAGWGLIEGVSAWMRERHPASGVNAGETAFRN